MNEFLNAYEGWYVDDVIVDWPTLTLADADIQFLHGGTDDDDLGAAVAGVGDVNGDGHNDFALLEANTTVGESQIYVFLGLSENLPRPADPTGWADQIIHLGYGLAGDDRLSILAAGNLNGDACDDLLVVGHGVDDEDNPVVANDIFLGSSENLIAIDPQTVQAGPSSVYPLIPLGNVNHDSRMYGDPPVEHLVDDLGRLWVRTGPTLTEDDGQLAHAAGQVLFGGSEGVDSVDLVVEPHHSFYFDPRHLLSGAEEAVFLRPHMFGNVGDVNNDGFDDFAIADSMARGVTVVFGREYVERELQESRSAGPEEFVFDLAAPLVAIIEPRTEGVRLTDEPTSIDLDEAFWLAGGATQELLSRAQDVGDFNGDGAADLLISGSDYSYLILGPVMITDQGLAADYATLVFDLAALGTPAKRMGDINGDGRADLIFTHWYGSNWNNVHIVYGQEEPDGRVISSADTTISIQPLPSSKGTSIHLQTVSASALNFDGDGFDDLLVHRTAMGTEQDEETVAGWILSGEDISEQPGVVSPDDVALAEILVDETATSDLAYQALVPFDDDSQRQRRLNGIAGGDINGDGLEDIVLANPVLVDFDGPEGTRRPFGRVYVLLGHSSDQLPASGEFALADCALYQDFDLGASLAALGDLNRDGYDDVGISRGGESAQRASLEVFFGSTTPQFHAGTSVVPLLGDLSIRRTDAANVPEGLSLRGPLDVTAGDFDRDGLMDLAIGETSRTVTNAANEILDRDTQGHLYVFWQVADWGAELLLADADVMVDGEETFDMFGRLPSDPGLDLNGDRFADLIVGAPTLTCWPNRCCRGPANSTSSRVGQDSSNCRREAR